jgi:hypothetical protein
MTKEALLTSLLPVTTASPNTSSPTLSLQFPLILLGREGVNKEWDDGSTRHTNRLNVIRDALQRFCPEVPVAVWQSRSFKDVYRHGKETEEKRLTWEQEERARWSSFEQAGGWVLRLTGDKAWTSRDGGGKMNEGEGLLTEVERKLVGGAVWVCPFTLQRFGVSVYRKEFLEKEIESIMRVLGKLSGFEYGELGAVFKIVSTERCWPRLCIKPNDNTLPNSNTAWNERTVRNIMLLHTAFERELLTLATPTFLLQHWPLSHFLTIRKVRQMRREWRRRRRVLGKGKEATWKSEKTLGGAKGCWEGLGEEGDEEIGGILGEMVRFEKELVVEFLLGECEDGNADHHFTRAPPESPLVLFPHISTLTFPIPRLRTSVSSAPLLAYIELLTKLFLFANQYTEDTVRMHIRRIRERSKEQDEGAVDTLRRVARVIGVRDGCVEDLEKILRYQDEGEAIQEDGPFAHLLRHVQGFYEEERGHMTTFLERYERAGGFLIPGNDKVSVLMELENMGKVV